MANIDNTVEHSLDAIFKPRSIAVIGATSREGSIGRQILRNLFDYGFNGKIFPVNPAHEYIHSTKSYATVLSIPDPIDLGIVVVPKEYVEQVVEDCGRKGVKGLVIISAGFREVGGDGVKREESIKAIAKRYGMRMIGPNCMGIIDATPTVRMNATFSPGIPGSGGLAFMTQSGALGVAILIATQKLGLGISYFASVGNKADISAIDLLEYWEHDKDTRVIALYLESFGDPAKFTALSRRISRSKPIVAVKSGTSAAGARAASSHTGSLAGLEVAADALLHQCGVIRVAAIEEMIDLVSGLSQAPIPRGNRVCVVTNAGGPAIMAADAAAAYGLTVGPLSEETQKAMRAVLSTEASVGNPIDMVASAGPDEYERTLDLALRDDSVDLAIVIFVPPLMVAPVEVMQRITSVARKYDKPVFSVLMAEEHHYETIPREIVNHVPFYRFPESATKVAAEMFRYGQWRDTPEGNVASFDVDAASARETVEKKRVAGGGYLCAADVFAILEAYGFPVCRHTVIPLDGDVAGEGNKIGYPLALKIDGQEIVHKSDTGGVVVGIENEEQLLAARDRIVESSRRAGTIEDATGLLLQEMAGEGKEVILGMTRDPNFGPLLMFGMGGKYVELIRDVAFRVMPVTDADARDMVRSIKTYPLLEGIRGEAGVDIDFVVESIGRLAQLVRDVEGIVELDINPVIVATKRGNCRVVDARIRVEE